MTDNLKTVDLNSLNSYTENLGNFISDDLMPLPSPKDILILNGELIDNYTGNGITKNGNAKIDENGIASGFSNLSSYLVTDLAWTKLYSQSFEIQIKFFPTQQYNWQALINQKNVHEAFSIDLGKNEFSFIGYTASGRKTFGVRMEIGTITNQWNYVYVKYDSVKKTLLTKLLDEDYQVSIEKESTVSDILSNASSANVLIGTNYQDFATPYVSIDLSETWFKDKDGNLISSWNK
jgi:hypothetical protein